MTPYRVQGVRIGGRDEDNKQRVAVSLEVVGEIAVEPATVAWVDWDAIPVVAGFTRQERAVWCHCWRNGTASGTMIGLVPHQLGAANREILRKLRKNRDALHPFLGYLSESELSLSNSWSTAQSRASLGALSRSLTVTISELNEKKTSEAGKLAHPGADPRRSPCLGRRAIRRYPDLNRAARRTRSGRVGRAGLAIANRRKNAFRGARQGSIG
jgi:hypothetical protein